MKAAVLQGPRDIRVEEVPDPRVEEPTDAVVRVTLSGVCGSDLHRYRGRFGARPGQRLGHEFVGVVEEVGSEVTRLRPGDVVVAPFAVSCGECPHCEREEYTSCFRGVLFGLGDAPGAQAEAVRVPFADSTLVPVPEALRDEEHLPTVLLLGDVAGTAEHAVQLADVRPDDIVVVVGDGAVGLCVALAAWRRGPRELVVVGHHPQRLEVAKRMGAQHTVDGRDVHVVDEVLETVGGLADVVIETVGGSHAPLDLAFALVRDYGSVSSVGVVGEDVRLPADEIFRRNLRYAAGVAPTRRYLPALLELLAQGSFDPSPVLTERMPLERVADAYARMDARDTIKVLLTVG